jgi:bifunctional non-homologous end joining protein LigD
VVARARSRLGPPPRRPVPEARAVAYARRVGTDRRSTTRAPEGTPAGSAAARAARAVEEAARLGAPVRRLGPQALAPMLAERADGPFDADGWIFELKYDGYRLLARREGGRAELRYRSGDEVTGLFPEIAAAVEALPADLALDGEVVVLAPAGRPAFQALQGRGGLTRREDQLRAAAEAPATLFAFDLLALAGRDLRALPLLARKRLLAEVVPRRGAVRFADHVEGRGADFYREVVARGLEGVMAKRADAPYRAGRARAWLKVRADRTADLAVVGFTAPRSGRRGFGALLLARREAGGWVFAGSVGSGFTDGDLSTLHARLRPRARAAPPCGGPVPAGPGNTWVAPEVVVEVRYREWTADGVLRLPVFLRVRDDRRVDEIEGAPGPDVQGTAGRGVILSNPGKVYFPAEGITKGELAGYYRAIAPHMLPYLADRPLVLTRFPDGIGGKSFFQKDAPGWRPSWIRTAAVRAEEGARELHHVLVDDAEGLAWLVNLGVIPIHVFAARAGALDRPDWCILDLDPKEAPFAHVARIARAARALCAELGLPVYAKTTGQRGLHLLVPLGRQLLHPQSRALAELLARVLEAELPELATTARALAARRGRVYLDWLQNGPGKTLAAPWTVRPQPGAPVSTPLRWEEVVDELEPTSFTIRNVVARATRGPDPLAPVLGEAPDLLAALQRLEPRLPRQRR